MRAVVITEHGPPEVLRSSSVPIREPGRGEVLVDVKAAGINFADLMARVGLYPDAPKPPAVVGYEVAGVVAGVGEGVDGPLRDRPARGGAGTVRRIRRTALWSRPTASSRFRMRSASRRAPRSRSTTRPRGRRSIRLGNVQPGERVLIHAAAGGVGIAATQIAKRIGAEIWGTSSPGKHEATRGFGVDHPVDYTRSGWERDVPKLDLVMDAIGGSSWRRSYKLLRAGGRLVCFGASSVMAGEKRNLVAAARMALQMPRFNLIKQMSDSKSVIGLNALTIWDEFGSAARWRVPLTELLADGTIRPVVAQSFPFERAPDAHRFIAERRNVGKVVLVP